MPSPFDTGIRLTVTPDPHRVRCDVDEFVLCPTNARADEAERALAKIADLMRCVPDDHDDLVEAVRLLVVEAGAWQAHAQAEAQAHLATTKRLIETEAALTAARADAAHLRHLLERTAP